MADWRSAPDWLQDMRTCVRFPSWLLRLPAALSTAVALAVVPAALTMWLLLAAMQMPSSHEPTTDALRIVRVVCSALRPGVMLASAKKPRSIFAVANGLHSLAMLIQRWSPHFQKAFCLGLSNEITFGWRIGVPLVVTC